MNDAPEKGVDQRGVLGVLRRTTLDVLFWVLGIGLVGANVFLLQQNRDLRSSAVAAAAPANIVAGKHLPHSMAAATLKNEFRPLAFPPADGKRTLLITFSPTCPHCKANHSNWSVVTEQLRHRDGWRVIWVSRDPVEMTKDYCEDSGIPIEEVFADPSYRVYAMLDLKMVPNTAVVDGRGVVEKLWPGELTADGWKDVFNYLQMPAHTTPSM